MNLKTEALAFLIWRHANPLEWNMTYVEVAEALGVSKERVRAICSLKKWTNRFRAPPSSGAFQGYMNRQGLAGAEVFEHQMELAEDMAGGVLE